MDHLSLSLSPRKRPRRKSKDRIHDLKIPLATKHSPTLSLTHSLSSTDGTVGGGGAATELDLHAWGLGDLKKEIKQFHELVVKCIEMFEGEVGPVVRLSNSLPLLGDQVQKWRTSRLKAQVLALWKSTAKNITQAETTFHIWLESIQTKKRLVKTDALNHIDELETSIAFHEQRLDEIDDKMDECKALSVFLKKQCNIFAAMKLFHQVQVSCLSF
jgi:hypothetical protein